MVTGFLGRLSPLPTVVRRYPFNESVEWLGPAMRRNFVWRGDEKCHDNLFSEFYFRPGFGLPLFHWAISNPAQTLSGRAEANGHRILHTNQLNKIPEIYWR